MRQLFFETKKSFLTAISCPGLTCFLLAGFLAAIAGPAMGAEVTLEWDISPSPDIEGYRVYYGTAVGNLSSSTDIGSSMSVVIPNLERGNTYYFAATAYTSEGTQSGYSNIVSTYIPLEGEATPTPTATPPGASTATPTRTPTPVFTATPTDSGPIDLVSGLSGHWQFDEGTGTSTADRSEGTNTGYLVNGPTWQTGKKGESVRFDGADDYIRVDAFSTQNANNQEGTVAFWLYQETADGANHFLSADTDHFINIRCTSGLIAFQLRNSVTTAAINFTGKAIPLNQWVHYVITWNLTSSAIYRDGVLDTQTASVSSPYVSLEGATLYLGHDRAIQDRSMQGQLDEFRIYTRALRASEAAALYAFALRDMAAKLAAAGADADRRVEEEREAHWLVEWPEDDNMPVRWWHPITGWMRDANKALRLSRKEDAEAVIATGRFVSGGVIRAAEHKFLSAIRSRSTREQVSDSSTAYSTASAPISQSNDHADTVSAEAPEIVTQTE